MVANLDYFGVLGMLFMLGALYYASKALRFYCWLRRGRYWRGARGHVVESRVREVEIGRGRIGVSTAYLPEVRYTYEAGGRRWESRRPEISGWLCASRDRAERLCARFPPGADVEVRFDPEDPGRACLVTRPWAAWPYAVGSACLLVLGVAHWLAAGR